ncbi:MAG TPA: hypothetical protein DDY52_03930 [Candidatus Moranbacteria bacterium]|nr:MAG: hypothetical protein UR51_C0008G0087 [Candidatus Moranbacteria bacterium GW2011_GWF1_34_10]HBI17264.1 hypothetical protein [Candidatus Moranbacteria bacterium]
MLKRNFKKVFFLSFFLWGFFAMIEEVSAATYYIDATSGSDLNSGITEDEAWQTIDKVNNSTFNSGDNILFKRGETWREQLIIPSSGSEGNPITFGAYGDGNAPKISKSDYYNNWWKISPFEKNGGFEIFTESNPNDDFISWAEYSGGSSYAKASSTEVMSGKYSLKLYTDGVNQPRVQRSNINPIVCNEQYYLEFYAKRESGQDTRVQLRTFGLLGGQYYYLQSDGSWGGSSNLFTISSSEWTKYSITFNYNPPNCENGALNIYLYGNAIGEEGVVYYDDFYFVRGSNEGSVHTWRGYRNDVYESFGAKTDLRSEKHYKYDNLVPFDDLENNYFYWNAIGGANTFYLRNDSGNPGNILVGARPYGILIDNSSNIVVENFLIADPGGRPDNNEYRDLGIKISGDSENILVRNIEIVDVTNVGINAENTTSNITYDNLSVHNCGSTGIYMKSQSGFILNSKSYNNGKLVTDAGDMGGIGSYQGGNIIIQGNEVYNNGRSSIDSDSEISVVGNTDHVTIKGNHVHDCLQGCIQIAEGGNGSIISNNIIDNFGSSTYQGPSTGKFGGIRIGGGAGGATDVEIKNNIIANGQRDSNSSHAGVVIANYDNQRMILKNNIFINNNSRDIYAHTDSNTTDNDFNNNIFYKADYTNNWYWKGVSYSSQEDWKINSLFDSRSLITNPLFSSNSPSQPPEFQLGYLSPAIDSGADVGLTADYAGNPIYGTPDIGAYEYQPPHVMGSDKINIEGGARIYNDGKFRDLSEIYNLGANLTITPENNFSNYEEDEIRPDFMDVTDIIWTAEKKEWTETANNISSTFHRVGDSTPNVYYYVKIDNELKNITGENCKDNICKADNSGNLNFTYVGSYSTHTFEITPREGEIVTKLTDADLKIDNKKETLGNDIKFYLEKDKAKLKGDNPEIAGGKVKIYKNDKFYEEISVDSNGRWFKTISFGHNHNYKIKIKFYDEFNTLRDIKEYNVKVDTKDPIFKNEVYNQKNSSHQVTRNERIAFQASDKETKIDYYKVKILDGNGHIIRKWKKQYEDFYIIPDKIKEEAQTVIVRAYDRAGNYREVNFGVK